MSVCEVVSTALESFFEDSDYARSELLHCVAVGSLYYVAYRSVDKELDFEKVSALVVVPEIWAWMSEDEGPCFDHCPYEILRLLTPTENLMAREWRMRCWVNLKMNRGIIPPSEAFSF